MKFESMIVSQNNSDPEDKIAGYVILVDPKIYIYQSMKPCKYENQKKSLNIYNEFYLFL